HTFASAKRNHEFHQLFRNVPESDRLIAGNDNLFLGYKCALQKDILVQGQLYITEHSLCFNANIFGWVTHIVIPFADITCIEKRMTAMIIPNGIQISTPHMKHVFASFLSRDVAFSRMEAMWRMRH
ncbi:GRAM domain-containing protein, partial [Dichotomocladium elegans]